MTIDAGPIRRTQAERSALTRTALLEAATRGLSKYGYANLALERVASDAGYTRGALYHVFANKEELALAVVDWVEESWNAEVRPLVAREADPVDALIALARGHVVYCRRDVADVLMNLRVEFTGQDHPVGRAVTEVIHRLADDCAELIVSGRESGAIPPGPAPRQLAFAYLIVMEAIAIQVAGKAPYDTELAERAVRGVLGLPPATVSPGVWSATAPTQTANTE